VFLRGRNWPLEHFRSDYREIVANAKSEAEGPMKPGANAGAGLTGVTAVCGGVWKQGVENRARGQGDIK
jgi:hypothetical protein